MYGKVLAVNVTGVGNIKKFTYDEWLDFKASPEAKAELQHRKDMGDFKNKTVDGAEVAADVLKSQGFMGHSILELDKSTVMVVYDPKSLKAASILKSEIEWYYVIPNSKTKVDAPD